MKIYVAYADGIVDVGVGMFVSNSKDKVIEEMSKFLSYNEESKTHDKIKKVLLAGKEDNIEIYNVYFESNEVVDEEPDWAFNVTETLLILA